MGRALLTSFTCSYSMLARNRIWFPPHQTVKKHDPFPLVDRGRKRLHQPSAGRDRTLPFFPILAFTKSLLAGSVACHKSIAYIFHMLLFHVGAKSESLANQA